jgi:hypothetical protein
MLALLCGALALLCGALALPRAALAQEEPTPFWLAPPPPAKKAPPAREKKKLAPDPGEAAPKTTKRRPEPLAPKPVPLEPAPKPARAKKSQRAPLAPEETEPLPARSPARPAAPIEPARRPAAPIVPEPSPEPDGRRPVRPLAPAPEPEDRPSPQPVRPSPAERASPESAASGSAQPPTLVVDPPPERTVDAEPQQRSHRRFTLDARAGLWGKSRSDGSPRFYDFAYGLSFGYAPLPDLLEVELVLARSGGTFGNAFANATTTENLAGLRALYVLGYDRYALLLGGGPGVVITQTHYLLQDVGGAPATLDAVGPKLVLSATAALRARIWGGLEVRAEVSGMLRDGRVEVLPLFGIGAAF